jgi:translation initiation factor IF-3
LSRPFTRSQPPTPQHRINGKIRAREVRVIGPDGQMAGVLDLGAAINLARVSGMDLVEVAPNAVPPVCRVVDYGKFKYELAKKERESKKHQHASTVKEIQLSPTIDPHDLGIKTEHAVGFLCEEMKVKITLRFKGRQMAHTEIGMGVVKKFLLEIAPWGHQDFEPKLIGRSINVMISPLPRNKRAKNPKQTPTPPPAQDSSKDKSKDGGSSESGNSSGHIPTDAAENPSNFGSNPFVGLQLPQS